MIWEILFVRFKALTNVGICFASGDSLNCAFAVSANCNAALVSFVGFIKAADLAAITALSRPCFVLIIWANFILFASTASEVLVLYAFFNSFIAPASDFWTSVPLFFLCSVVLPKLVVANCFIALFAAALYFATFCVNFSIFFCAFACLLLGDLLNNDVLLPNGSPFALPWTFAIFVARASLYACCLKESFAILTADCFPNTSFCACKANDWVLV